MSETENTEQRKAQKSPDAFRTISEVSEELDIPQHVLRFWETKFTIVKPLKRGGGRRYYRPSDVEIIRGIRDLLYTHGFTIKGAQKLLKEQGGKIENIEVLSSGSPAPTASLLTTETQQEQSPIEDADAQSHNSNDLKGELKSVLEELQAIRRLLPR
ncbi:MerR family transcriptional regulator [Sneathiella glossodoripedis]|uniref:MerR family transcriptional regulator n=1 Tax=Sneathiella glossodoripedis TaxID=418853 RepID=UPI000472AF81|nr:MerR family transcriptional regulator [Sneathiella glossodoripedis]